MRRLAEKARAILAATDLAREGEATLQKAHEQAIRSGWSESSWALVLQAKANRDAAEAAYLAARAELELELVSVGV